MRYTGFSTLQSDPCIYHQDGIWLLLYVDDVILMSKSSSKIAETIDNLSARIEINDLGSLHHFLGVSFIRR